MAESVGFRARRTRAEPVQGVSAYRAGKPTRKALKQLACFRSPSQSSGFICYLTSLALFLLFVLFGDRISCSPD